MPSITMIAPGVCQITVQCPLCEEDVAVVHHEGTERFDVPHACDACGHDFLREQRWTLLDTAKRALDNYGGPTDRELEASRVMPLPSIAESLAALRGVR